MRNLFLFLLIFFLSHLHAQQTLSLKLQQVDSIFLQKNLMVLAQQYNVDAQKALIQQAKLWQNPVLSTEWNLYNPAKDKFFDVGQNGQKVIAVQQLIYIAGKRNKRVALAQQQAKYSEYELNDLMRTLKLTLHSTFFGLYYSENTVRKYETQIGLLQNLIDAMEVQTTKGNIPLKELVRLKALYFKISNERNLILAEKFDYHQQLQTLLSTNDSIIPLADDNDLTRYNLNTFSRTQLADVASSSRPDLQMAENISKQAETNTALQKSLAYPDLQLGATYDQAGSYVNNYTALTLGLDLPFWNRNQGNIRYAKGIEKSTRNQYQLKQLAVVNEVNAAYNNVVNAETLYQKTSQSFSRDLETINNGYLENFQKRNISLLEFIDFFEAYSETIQQQNQLNQNRIQAYEELNFTVGKELFGK